MHTRLHLGPIPNITKYHSVYHFTERLKDLARIHDDVAVKGVWT